MPYGRVYGFSTLALVTGLALPVNGQSVIATRSGVVHFFEGAVYLGDQPLEPHLGKFPRLAEGADLRTAQGRAEVLLTPGVFLRVGDSSAIRMVSNALSDTRVELLAGSAIVDSVEPNQGTSVTLIYRNWNVRFLERGFYRIQSEPPRLWVRQGEAEVSAGNAGTPVSVKQGMYLPLAAVLVPERSIDEPRDALTDWAKGRSESVFADNAITAQIDEDPAARTASVGLDSFTYFPLIGVPPPSLGFSGQYSPLGLYQPGFSSIYLPGYTYRPLLLGLAPRGFRSYPFSTQRPYSTLSPYVSPRPFGASPGVGAVVPRAPVSRPVPGPAHPLPHGGVHGGVRR
jgi:hypothetical protein